MSAETKRFSVMIHSNNDKYADRIVECSINIRKTRVCLNFLNI